MVDRRSAWFTLGAEGWVGRGGGGDYRDDPGDQPRPVWHRLVCREVVGFLVRPALTR